MTKKRITDFKTDSLRKLGSLNPHPEKVIDPLFAASDFFDKRDLSQVKYEMVRRVKSDGQSISQSASAFGFSRPSFYQAQAALEREGLGGLIPKKRGPRGSHKLDSEVVAFLRQQLAQDSSLNSSALASQLEEHFKLKVHPRSVERALKRQEKKLP